jgi:hypothetical protein
LLLVLFLVMLEVVFCFVAFVMVEGTPMFSSRISVVVVMVVVTLRFRVWHRSCLPVASISPGGDLA